jgi:hypothetical protein
MVDMSLRRGLRGLSGGSSLAQFLGKKRGRRTRTLLPPLSVEKVLKWCDAHHRRTGEWPGQSSGPIAGAAGETWQAIETALQRGRRGLPGGLSIAKLLAKERDVPNQKALPRLTYKRILEWCDAHFRQTGKWPTRKSGPVAGAPPNETWGRIDESLRVGTRGLPGGRSLSRLLDEKRRRRGQPV